MIDHVIFDIGGVLIGWDPELLYRDLIPDPDKRATFLKTVVSPEWNNRLDLGENWLKVEKDLIELYPSWEKEIIAYRTERMTMISGPLPGAFVLVHELKELGIKLTALSNWNDVAFADLLDRYPIFETFDGRTVSGEVGYSKPGRRIYSLHAERFDVIPENVLFIDDRLANIQTAKSFGWGALHHKNIPESREAIQRCGINLRAG